MDQTCKTCVHFQQHYVKLHRKYTEASSGHCIYPRIKLRYERTPACEHYQPAKKED